MNEDYAKAIFEKLYLEGEENSKKKNARQNQLDSLKQFAQIIEQQSENEVSASAYSHGLAYRHVDDSVIYNTSIDTALVAKGHSRGIIFEDELVDISHKLSLDELRKQALELGYSLQKIEYESTDLTGTNKIKLKD